MHHHSCKFGLIAIISIAVTNADIGEEKGHNVESVDKRQGSYDNNIPSGNEYGNSPYNYELSSYQKQYSNDATKYNYNPDEVGQRADDYFTSTAGDRQDALGGDFMSILTFGLAAFAAGGVAVSLWQNAQQAEDIDTLKELTSRVSSLETDQTSICTSVKAFASADDGITISGNYDDGGALESGYLKALAAASSPTCS